NFNFSVPQLVAGAAALAIVVSIGVIVSSGEPGRLQCLETTGPGQDSQPHTSVQQLEKQSTQLSVAVEQRKESWDPELRTAFERNLLYIDQSLVECRHHLTDSLS